MEFAGNFFVPEGYIPKPDQLRKVASTALIIARQTNKLLEVNGGHSTPVYFWVDAKLGQNDEVGSDEYTSRSARYQRHIKASDSEAVASSVLDHKGSIGSGVSTLHYRQIKQHRLIGDHWRGELRQYSFEWNSDKVTRSECRVSEVPSIEAGEVEVVYQQMLEEYSHLDPEGESDLNLQLRLLAGEQTVREVVFVSRDECARLLGMMRRVRLEKEQLTGVA